MGLTELLLCSFDRCVYIPLTIEDHSTRFSSHDMPAFDVSLWCVRLEDYRAGSIWWTESITLHGFVSFSLDLPVGPTWMDDRFSPSQWVSPINLLLQPILIVEGHSPNKTNCTREGPIAVISDICHLGFKLIGPITRFGFKLIICSEDEVFSSAWACFLGKWRSKLAPP